MRLRGAPVSLRAGWLIRHLLVFLTLVGLIGLPAVVPAAWLGAVWANSAIAAPAPSSGRGRESPSAAEPPKAPEVRGSALGRTLSGAGTSLLTIAGAVALVLPIGILLGAFAGSGSLLADALLARLGELSSALPPILIVGLLHAARLMPVAVAIAVVLGVARGIELGRLLRGEMLRITGEDFVTAARALGLSNRQLWLRHVLPHSLGPVLVSGALTAAAAVALDAALGLFGLGSPSTWGGQIAFGLTRGSFADVLWPSLAAMATTGALYSLAEALSEGASARRRHAP